MSFTAEHDTIKKHTCLREQYECITLRFQSCNRQDMDVNKHKQTFHFIPRKQTNIGPVVALIIVVCHLKVTDD
jgi:hypothetical protein